MRNGANFLGILGEGGMMSSGKYVFKSGEVYEGQFLNNKFHGNGSYIDSFGVIYEGSWAQNQKHGHGKEQWPDGTVFEGNFENGKKTGPGKIIFPDFSEYTGEFTNDDAEGNGIYRSLEYEYHGNWHENKPHGQGKSIWKNKKCVYFGEYYKGVKHGLGRLICENRKVFAGHWSLGKKDGKGIEFDSFGGKIKGVWNNGEKISDIKSDSDEEFSEIYSFLEKNKEETTF